MRHLFFIFFLFWACFCADVEEAFRPTAGAFQDWMAEGGFSTKSDDSLFEIGRKVYNRLETFTKEPYGIFQKLPNATFSTKKGKSNSSEYPYFGFLPKYRGSVLPGQKITLSPSSCWKTIVLSLEVSRDLSKMTLRIFTSDSVAWLCADFYVFATVSHFQFGFVAAPIPGFKSYIFNLTTLTSAEIWDINNKGVRAFSIRDDIVNLKNDFDATRKLLSPMFVKPTPESDLANLEFMEKYRGIKYEKRKTNIVLLNESLIHSGDLFGVFVLNGLESFDAWLVGSRIGHVAMAMWIKGELYIIESQRNNIEPNKNGIIRTPYQTWLKEYFMDSCNVVYSPLSEKARARFNADAAFEFFVSQENLDYGYQNALTCTIDTVNDNYPCLPPYPRTEESYCFTWELMEVLWPNLSRMIPYFDIFYLETWNRRANTVGLSAAEVLKEVGDIGMKASDLFTLPEQDSWLYEQKYNNGTKVMGRRMICNVFVCMLWKYGGLFDDLPLGRDSINCGEVNIVDLYNLDILGIPNPRPPQCVEADPDNFLCQIMGEYSLKLNEATYAKRNPEAHMYERCPGFPPEYKRPPRC